MQVQKIALQRALTMLQAAGCTYCVVEADGTKHGTLEVAAAPSAAKRAPGPFPRGAMRDHYLPYLTAVEVGGNTFIPYGNFATTPEGKSALRGAVSSWCSAKWGNQTYLTHMAETGIELVRVG